MLNVKTSANTECLIYYNSKKYHFLELQLPQFSTTHSGLTPPAPCVTQTLPPVPPHSGGSFTDLKKAHISCFSWSLKCRRPQRPASFYARLRILCAHNEGSIYSRPLVCGTNKSALKGEKSTAARASGVSNGPSL